MQTNLKSILDELDQRGEELILIKLQDHPDILEEGGGKNYTVISKKIGDGYMTNNKRNFAARAWVRGKGFVAAYYGDSLNEYEFRDYAKSVEFALR